MARGPKSHPETGETETGDTATETETETEKAGGGPPRWPVPLPLHLGLTNLILASSCAAWPLARNGSIDWKPACRSDAAELLPLLRACPPELLGPAVLEAACARLSQVQSGIERYAADPPARPAPPGPMVWQAGTTRIYDGAPHLAGRGGPHVLLVPSLINRAHILALGDGHGLVGHLAAAGIRPLLLDWDRPGPAEGGFGIADYVEERVRPALRFAAAQAAQVQAAQVPARRRSAPPARPVVLGYCMGGLLTLAALLGAQADGEAEGLASGLALVATPWDFGADPLFSAVGALMLAQEASMRRWIRSAGGLPPEFLQALFVMRDPALPLRKFSGFAGLPAGSAAAGDFLDLEGWANDGVPLAGPAAEECLFDWFGRNAPATDAWQIRGQVMRPEALTLPVFAAIAGRDRLVPPVSAEALVGRLAQAVTIRGPGGHVGMVAGRGARTGLWQPLAEWVLACCSAA